jgi:predicted PurR-regulated permease PerM
MVQTGNEQKDGAKSAVDDDDFLIAVEGDRSRDRLVAAIALATGGGFFLALPFALRAGAEFFMPLTAALVIAITLVPMLEWLERHRFPPALAALTALAGFLTMANIALVLIIVPASEWIAALPSRISRIRSNIEPLIELFTQAQRFVDELIRSLATGRPIGAKVPAGVAVQNVETPGSLLQLIASSAPSMVVSIFFALLIIYFVLAGWTRLRRASIVGRENFGGAVAIARVIQNVVDATSRYVLTISYINVLLGLVVALALAVIGMPSPVMWGGIVALLNFVPYFGPILAALLLGLGGLMTFDTVFMALLPAIIMTGAHFIEANIITPLVLGGRLKMNPLVILVSLSFWGWVWGTIGALLAVPLAIIIRTIIDAAGKPDIAGFLFESGTLVRAAHVVQEPSDAVPAKES